MSTTQTAVRIPDDLLKEIDSLAHERGTTRAKVIIEALRIALSKPDPESITTSPAVPPIDELLKQMSLLQKRMTKLEKRIKVNEQGSSISTA